MVVGSQVEFLIFILFRRKSIEYRFSSVPFTTFKGNSFDSGVLFPLYEQLKEFFEAVKDDNKVFHMWL